jgi:alpha-tubulin suppressor-like RCC1 family protein
MMLGVMLAAPAQVSVVGASEHVAGHTLILMEDRTVQAHGDNSRGQLGDGTRISRDEPRLVEGLEDVVAVAACGEHSLALSADGFVWAWGDNRRGQLGDNTRQLRTRPVLVMLIYGVEEITCDPTASGARKGDGSLWTWGANPEPGAEDRLIPAPSRGPDLRRVPRSDGAAR